MDRLPRMASEHRVISVPDEHSPKGLTTEELLKSLVGSLAPSVAIRQSPSLAISGLALWVYEKTGPVLRTAPSHSWPTLCAEPNLQASGNQPEPPGGTLL